MTIDELLKTLDGFGLGIERQSLNRYVRWGLVSPPDQRAGGRGVKANFPEEAVLQAVVAAELMQNLGWRKEWIIQARRLAGELGSYGFDAETEPLDRFREVLKAQIWFEVVNYYLSRRK